MTARGNGLRASRYAVLVEIEESLGDPLLLALAERKIAAYVVPASGPGGATRLILHVDALRRVPAGIVLAGLTPTPAGERPADPEPAAQQPGSRSAEDRSAEDVAADATFAEIVAGFDRVPDQRTWPEAEDIPAPPLAPPAPTFGPPPLADHRVAPPSGRSLPEPDAERGEDQEQDHYRPPPLPRLDPPSRATRWALLALGIGIALLLLPTLFELGHRTSLDIAGVLCVVGAAGVLLTRLRDRSPDDPDDGAVV
jgi:hypothetical protein